MRFRKSEKAVETVPFPGRADVVDGYTALLESERLATDSFVVSAGHRAAGFPVPVPEPSFVDGNSGAPAPDQPLQMVHAADDHDVAAMLEGFALEGLRAGALADGGAGFTDGLAAAAGRRLPVVVHLGGHPRTRQAGSPRGAHDSYHDAADTGAFLMFARNAQEVADYALIARRIAEQSLTPGLCAHDRYATSHSVRRVRLADEGLVERFLGRAHDTIDCPTDAQKVLFGPTRRRVPVLLDPDQPAGVGGTQDAESYFRALAAQRVFFSDHLAAIVDDAMREFGALTGRTYGRASGYRLDDAEFVVAAQGALADELEPVVDFLRRERKIKAGVLNLAVLRPFPGAAVSHLLSGKRAVTVLERTDSHLAEDTPLLRDVRAAVDRAAENGESRSADPIHPGYAVFRRGEKPFLLSGVYGVGTSLPGFAQMVAVFENMTAGDARRHFYLGAGFDVETRRFPHLQTMRQRLDREYPAIARLSVDAPASPADPGRNDGTFEMHSLSVQGALFAGNMFAQALSRTMEWTVRTYPDGGLDRNLQPVQFRLAFRKAPDEACTLPVVADAALVSGEHLIETLAQDATLRSEGTLIAGSVREPEILWRSLSRRTAQWIRSRSLAFHVVDARRIAEETTAHPSFVDQLSIWALLGAYSRVHLGLTGTETVRIEDALRARLRNEPGLDTASIDEVVLTFRRGADECATVPWKDWAGVEHPVGEPDTPWTVRQLTERDGTVFDASRFWHSVGYLYDRGQPASTIADPYLATAIVPARSSAFRDMTPYRLRIPSWLPGRCTGCGVCWTQCPESALPATVRSFRELIDAAMGACERAGTPLVQMKRLAENLGKFAARAAARKAPHPYETLSQVLSDAFESLVDKAGLDGDKLVTARAEFDRLSETIGGFPVAVTDAFFSAHESASAGTGRLLSIALNPLSCTACGICVVECPEDAIEWTDQTPAVVASARSAWDFLMQLPRADAGAIASLVSAADPATNMNRLLDRDVYHSLVGGDGSFPGNGARTAVHLVTATIESELRPRFDAHAGRLSALIGRIEDRIQGKIQEGLRVNDFEEFSRRLQRLDSGEITPAALMDVLGNGDGGRTVDATLLARLSQLLRDLKEQHRSYQSGRACMVLAVDSRPGVFWSGIYPYNPHPQPWATQRAGDAMTMADAVSEALSRQVAFELTACRRAEDALRDAADPPAEISWHDLTAEERRLIPRVIVFTCPEAMNVEKAWNTLAGGLPVTVVVLDGDGIATGPSSGRLPTTMRMLGAGGRFVAQTSIGEPGHLMQAVSDSLTSGGPALFRVYAPDPVASGVAPDRTAELARLAVRTRAVPVFVAQPDATGGARSLFGNPDAENDWTSAALNITEPSGTESSIDVTLTVADWAVGQARFRSHFRVMSKGHRGDRMKRLSDFLALGDGAREGIQPYIDVRDRNGRQAIALVSREMTRIVEDALRSWRDLRGATPAAAPAVRGRAETPAETTAPAASHPTSPDAHRALVENLLRLSGYGSGDSFFKRSLREFVARERNAGEEKE